MEDQSVYLFSSTLSWELQDKIRDLSLYADDIHEAMLRKCELSLKNIDESKRKKKNEKNFKCKFCKKHFISRTSLDIHVRSHYEFGLK